MTRAAAGSMKSFRIERMSGAQSTVSVQGPGISTADTQSILDAIAELREAILPEEQGTKAETASQAATQQSMDAFHKELAEARALHDEMASIQKAILETKSEIATLHFSGFKGRDINRVTDELDAVVEGTEAATEEILAAAEIIEERSGNLSAKLEGDDQGMANDIAEASMRIFEACNFQDITGQRITKVVQALRFIETRVEHMLEIWGGLESFSNIPRHVVGMEGEQALLNGPALEDDNGIASQDDIDALFS